MLNCLSAIGKTRNGFLQTGQSLEFWHEDFYIGNLCISLIAQLIPVLSVSSWQCDLGQIKIILQLFYHVQLCVFQKPWKLIKIIINSLYTKVLVNLCEFFTFLIKLINFIKIGLKGMDQCLSHSCHSPCYHVTKTSCRNYSAEWRLILL